MSIHQTLCYSLIQATVDLDSIEDDDVKASIEEMIEAVSRGDLEGAKKLAPSIDFEFNAENMDGGWEDYLEDPFFNVEVNPSQYVVNVEDGQIKFSFEIEFQLELKDDADIDQFREWLEENGGWMACTASGSWSYLDDEGGELVVNSLE